MPGQEERISALHTRLSQGTYLTAQLPKGIVVGEKLANSLDATVGAEIVLVTQAVDGSMGNDLYTVVGIFRTGLEALDRGLVLMSLASLQELLSLEPSRVHEVGVLLSDAGEATAVAATLQARCSTILPVQVQAWPELSPELAEYVRLNRSGTAVISVTCMGKRWKYSLLSPPGCSPAACNWPARYCAPFSSPGVPAWRP